MSQRITSGIDIRVENLGKRFNREWIFRKFNFNFKAGNTYAITGPNGSGKSTLLQVLWGQMPQSMGSISYQSQRKKHSVEEIYKLISVATPYMDLIDEFTLQEQFDFHFKIKTARNKMSVQDMLEKLNLEHAKDKQLVNFSSGMRQRVKLGLAFFSEADLLFLDEPTTNLDNVASKWYIENLQQIPRETLIFIASNNADEYVTANTHINIMDIK